MGGENSITPFTAIETRIRNAITSEVSPCRYALAEQLRLAADASLLEPVRLALKAELDDGAGA